MSSTKFTKELIEQLSAITGTRITRGDIIVFLANRTGFISPEISNQLARIGKMQEWEIKEFLKPFMDDSIYHKIDQKRLVTLAYSEPMSDDLNKDHRVFGKVESAQKRFDDILNAYGKDNILEVCARLNSAGIGLSKISKLIEERKFPNRKQIRAIAHITKHTQEEIICVFGGNGLVE